MTRSPEPLPAALDVTGGFAALAGQHGAESEARLAGQSVRLVAFSGTGGWHQHAAAEETVIVWSGVFDVEYRDGTVRLEAGQCTVIPCGREHRGVSASGAQVMLLRPAQ